MGLPTPAEKVAFVDEILSGVRQHILERADKIPDDWDGIELRRLMTDYFRLYVDLPSRMTGNTRRALNYKQELVRKNLL